MTWQAGTANDYLDLLDQLEKIATSNHVDTAAPSAGGTGYVVGDILTDASVDGTQSHRATFEVTTVGGGGDVTGLRIVNGGAYTVNPASPIITSGGTGSGATITVTFAATGWTTLLDNTPGGEREIIMEGVGGGSDSILVGIKTYQITPGFVTGHNWALVGMTAFNGGLPFYQQPGISPGLDPTDGTTETSGGAFVPLQNNVGGSFPIPFWLSISTRRIVGVARVEDASETVYCSFYMGFHDQFGTSAEFPYPLIVAGSTARNDTVFNDGVDGRITGLTELIGITAKEGPMFYRRSDAVWQDVKNSNLSDTASLTRTASELYTCYPCGQSDNTGPVPPEDEVVQDGQGFSWRQIIPNSGVPGSPSLQLEPTPQTGGDLYLLVPATVVASDTNFVEAIGELNSVFWVSTAGVVSSEDTITQGAERYHVFQCGTRTLPWSFMALLEN